MRPTRAFIAFALVIGTARTAAPQEQTDSMIAARQPRFFVEGLNARAPVDLARSPSLTRRVTLDLSRARLTDAIGELSRRAGMAIVFSSDVVPKDKRVDLRAKEISVAAALTELLLDCNVDVIMHSDGSAALVPRRTAPRPAYATLAGKITEAASGAPLALASITIDGSAAATTTRDDGTYRIPGISAGAHDVNVRRVGYGQIQRSISVDSGQDVTFDAQLVAAVASLDAQVTTATGQQRRIELGNTIATVAATTRTSSAPVKNLGDLLTAQLVGVQVADANLTGGTSRVRIRGQSSMALSNDPIYIIDGVRMTSTFGGAGTGGINANTTNTVPSRVNDIDPEQIETIEVVKGPSAATLYGTDAANGVIVITTKRGRPGAATWSFRAERGRLDDRNDYPATYNLLGRSPGSAGQRTCFTYQVGDGTCLLDSAVSLNLFKTPELTTLKLGSRSLVGAQVSGGSEAVRYLVSVDANSETGPVGIPAVFESQFKARGVPLPDNVRRPSALGQLSLRTNVNAAVNPRFDLAASAGVTNLEVRFPQQGNNGTASYTEYEEWGPGYNDGSVDAYGDPLHGYILASPANVFQLVSRQNARRFIGALNANWRAAGWLQARGDLGYDLTSQGDTYLQRPGEGPSQSRSSATDSRTTLVTFTNNLGATATWQALRWAQLRTTVGAQFVMRTSSTVSATGVNLAPGGESPSQGATFSVTSSNNPSKTLGAYVEEQVALRDRLYLTAALRSDRNSAFGVDYGSAYYPKASVSWVASDESFFPGITALDQLRFRASYGASGVQPGATASLRLYNVVNVTAQGVTSAGLAQAQPGNPGLRPERSGEFEGGADARLFGGRVNVELTYYRKSTRDALILQPVAPSAGVNSFLANLGGVRNSGTEYRVQAQLVDRRSVGLDLTLGGSHNTNRIESLGGFVTTRTAANQVGYPINSIFLRNMGWSDPNGDGLLTLNDVNVGSATDVHWGGQALPPTQLSLLAGVELFQRRLRLSALADRKTGAVALNGELWLPCQLQVFSCLDQKRLDLPLWRQARGIAALRLGYPNSYVESSDYTRLREISASYDLGPALAQRIGGKSIHATAAVRNVKLWSKWTGTDPESFEGSGGDLPTFFGGTSAPPMYYMLRFNITY